MTGPELTTYRKTRGFTQSEFALWLIPHRPPSRMTIHTWEKKGPPAWVVSALHQRGTPA